MSDEHDLAKALVEAGHADLAAELELKRLSQGLTAAGRDDLASALTEPQPEAEPEPEPEAAPEPEPEPEPEPQSEHELVARERGRLNQGWMRLKA